MTTPYRPDLEGLSSEEMIKTVGTWYHVLELDGIKTPGFYDMEPFLAEYELPTDLGGTSVIDVGASNGFFSFWFEAHGADQVVATDLPNYTAHDYPSWIVERERENRSPEELARIDWDELHGGFTVAHRLLGSSVRRVLCRIYDLRQHLTPSFDLAFCSNVFIHLLNPIGAIDAIRSVLRPGGRAIFATPIIDAFEDKSAALLIGDPQMCGWWVPTVAGFECMARAAGFGSVRCVGSFVISRTHGEPGTDRIGVFHCGDPWAPGS